MEATQPPWACCSTACQSLCWKKWHFFLYPAGPSSFASVYSCYSSLSHHTPLWRAWLYLLNHIPEGRGRLLWGLQNHLFFRLNKPQSLSISSQSECSSPLSSGSPSLHLLPFVSFLDWVAQDWTQPESNVTTAEQRGLITSLAMLLKAGRLLCG